MTDEATSETTIEEMIAQQADLARQIAARSIPEVEAAIALFTTDGAQDLLAQTRALHSRLGAGLAKQNLANVLQVFNQVPNNLKIALSALQREAAA
ncbi:hypothetical protein GCM10007897_15230 [Sphingobium jiangsuense]|uniref:Uncharacterized protein n=1 Tax=Sphingobium jiangsuense TaxID=870476 RepID=A0A7W6FNZ4_9SPHN|nr:hypothetical protein [Sphingobium jiangsuense]MBB3925032.1 hypothetical protein [Sphingobium jiangsuense]GLT00139.1 hypothetical protein GCM10007897_15230 [Sphingobium jiangsuense]